MEQPKQFLTQDQVALIKKPLPREAVTPHPTKQNLSTIKAIYVTERLNDVFGIGSWVIQTDIIGEIIEKTRTTSSGRERTEYTAILKTCLSIPDYGIHYESIASSVNDDPGDACKGATTDAITKICSYIGIGIDVFKGQHDAALNNYQNESVTKYIDAVNKFDTKEGITEFAKTLPDEVKMNTTFRKAVSDKLKSL